MSSNSSESESSYHSGSEDVREYSDYEREVELSSENESTLYTERSRLISPIDLKIDNLDRVSIPTKIVATFDVEHPILGTTNEHPKSVNSGKITNALHVFYLNLNLLAQNSANCSDTGIQLRMHALFRRHKWSQESGLRHQKWPRFL